MPPKGKEKSAKAKSTGDFYRTATAETTAAPQSPVDAMSEGTQQRFIKTRTSNAIAHPGKVQVEADAAIAADEERKFKIKPTPEEAKAAKGRTTLAKAESAEKRKKTIEQIALLQRSLQDSDAADTTRASERPQYVDPANLPVTEGDSSDVTMHSNVSSPPVTDAEDNLMHSGPRKKYKFFGLASEDSDEESVSDYKPVLGGEGEISEPEVDAGVPPAATMPASMSAKKSGGKKLSARKERGLALQQDIEAAKAVQDPTEPENEACKRKISIHESAEKEKKKLKNTNEISGRIQGGGIQSDWRTIALQDASMAKPNAGAMPPALRPSAKLSAVGFKTANVALGSSMVDDDATERQTGPASFVKAPRATAAMGVKIEYNKPKESIDEVANKTKSKPQRSVTALPPQPLPGHVM